MKKTIFILVLASFLVRACSKSTEPDAPFYGIILSPPSVDVYEGRSVSVFAIKNPPLEPGEEFYWQVWPPVLVCVMPIPMITDATYKQVSIDGFEHGFDTIKVRTSYNQEVAAYLPITVRHVSARSITLIADTNVIRVGSGPAAMLYPQIRDSVGIYLPRYNVEWYLSDTLVARLDAYRGWPCSGRPSALVFGLRPGQVTIFARSDGVESNNVLIRVDP